MSENFCDYTWETTMSHGNHRNVQKWTVLPRDTMCPAGICGIPWDTGNFPTANTVCVRNYSMHVKYTLRSGILWVVQGGGGGEERYMYAIPTHWQPHLVMRCELAPQKGWCCYTFCFHDVIILLYLLKYISYPHILGIILKVIYYATFM